MKKTLLVCGALASSSFAFFNFGSLFVRIGELTSPLREKTIANTYHESALGSGQVVANVNVFNGQSTFTLPLGRVDMRGKLRWPLNLQYGGNTRLMVDADNLVSPSSWVGLGWSLETPNVAINHKGTFATADDVIFVNLGPDGGGQLLQKNGRFFIANNPFIKVTAQLAPSSGDLAGQFDEWTFELPSGVKYVMGSADGVVSNSERNIFYTGNLVQVSPFSLASAKPFLYRWDLRKIVDPEARNEIHFAYDRFFQPVFPGAAKQFVRESYVNSIQWFDRLGNSAEQYVFTTAAKTASEWVEDDAVTPRTAQRPVETRYLDRVACHKSGRQTHEVRLAFSLVGSGKYVKRLLTSVQGAHNHPVSTVLPALQTVRPWTLAYEGANRHYMLQSVTTPSGGKAVFQYRAFVSGDFFPYGMQAPLDDTLKTVLSGVPVPVVPPADAAQRNRWQNTAQCDERFCYTTVVTDESGANGQRLYAEIRHNPGNYFDSTRVTRLHGVSDGTPNAWAFFPVGDYVALANMIQGRLFPFAWNGLGFDSVPVDPGPVDNPLGLPNFFGNPTGPGNPISFHPGANHFLVHKHGSVNKTWAFVEDPQPMGGRLFRRLNQNAAACDLDNSNAFGEAVKDAADGCLEWRGSDNVQIFPGPNLVTMVHDPTDVIFAYAWNKAGNGFTNLSSSFLPFDATIHHGTFPNNWQKHIESIRHGPDYFVVKSVDGASGRLDVMHFDGVNVRRVASSGWHANGVDDKLEVFTSDEYFIEANHTTGQIVYWKKRVSADGLSLFFEPHVVRTDWNADAMDLRAKAFPGAFTLEYLPNGDLSSTARPLREAPANPAGVCLLPTGEPRDYRSYLYQVTRGAAQEFLDRSADLKVVINGCATKLFDVAFSASDNFLNGVTAREPTAQDRTCAAVDTLCAVFRQTSKIRSLAIAGQPYLYDLGGIQLADFVQARTKHDLFAEAARLGMSSVISEVKLLVLQRFYGYDGRDFEGAPDNLFYVERTMEDDGMDASSRDKTLAFSHDIREFNYYSQSPMFELATVAPVGDKSIGDQRFTFHLDLAASPLVGRRLKLNGMVRLQRSGDAGGGVAHILVPGYMEEDALSASFDPAWPEMISLNRQASQTTLLVKPPGVRISTDSFLVYNNVNGQAHFSKSLRSGLWHISQSIFSPAGTMVQSIDHAFPFDPLQPTGPSLAGAPTGQPLSFTHALASVKTEYEPGSPFLLRNDSLWRDVDETLTEADLRAGREPVWDLRQGWTLRDQTTLRNLENQPLEMTGYRGGAPALATSVVYEGRRSDPIAKISNSRLANCAVLQGENGDVLGLTTLDWEGRWTGPGTIFTNEQARTGQNSLKVTDNYGPTINLFLSGVREEGFGFTASAWFYAPPGVTPVFTVERRNASGVLINSFTASPVGGPKQDNRWQRWELILTNAQLIAGGLFNGSADFLRVRAGTGAPAGNSGRILYVDDVVLKPDRADFALITYNHAGQPTSQTDAHHVTQRFEYDFRGAVSAVRDERHRILSQSANHLPGEND